MIVGILGAIPISFRFDGRSLDNRNCPIKTTYSKKRAQRMQQTFVEYAPEDFFDFYNSSESEENIGGKKITLTSYKIKPEILLPNFKDFFIEFHTFLGTYPKYMKEESLEKFDEKYDAIVAANDLDGFLAHFDDYESGQDNYPPYIFKYLETDYISDCTHLLIYEGDFGAFLVDSIVFEHMERMAWTSIKHPLVKVVRFGGIY
jgi:hypothetical protein